MMGYYWEMGFAWLGMVLSWVSVVAAVAYLFRAFPQGQAPVIMRPGRWKSCASATPRARSARRSLGRAGAP